MTAEIKFLNFKPAKEIKDHAFEVIQRIYDLAPSDADLVTAIRRQGHEIIVDLKVCSSSLRCTCHATAKTICGALDKAIAEIEDQIFDWKAQIALAR